MLIYTMLVSWSQTNQQLLRQIAHTASSSFQARASWLQLLTVHDLVVPLWDPPPLINSPGSFKPWGQAEKLAPHSRYSSTCFSMTGRQQKAGSTFNFHLEPDHCIIHHISAWQSLGMAACVM